MTRLPKSAIGSGPHPRILVRGANWIGDVVMSMPAVQRLREFEPNAHIAMLCHEKVRMLWDHNPHLNEVISFNPRPDIGELRRKKFDVAILFPRSFRSAWEVWRAGIPCRVGFDGDGRRWLLTDAVKQSRSERRAYKKIEVNQVRFRVKTYPVMRHQSRHYLDLISYIGGNRDFTMPRLRFGIEDMPHINKFMRDDGRPVLAIHAGAEYGPAKRWIPERFAQTALLVMRELDCRWLLLGSESDVPVADEIASHILAERPDPSTVVNAAGKTSLVELFALLKMARVLVTNDTGPMHMAYALGTPLVAIFGSTSPELTGPLGENSVVIRQPVECSPCFLRTCPIDFRCMKRVTPEQVAHAAVNLFIRTLPQPHLKRF